MKLKLFIFLCFVLIIGAYTSAQIVNVQNPDCNDSVVYVPGMFNKLPISFTEYAVDYPVINFRKIIRGKSQYQNELIESKISNNCPYDLSYGSYTKDLRSNNLIDREYIKYGDNKFYIDSIFKINYYKKALWLNNLVLVVPFYWILIRYTKY